MLLTLVCDVFRSIFLNGYQDSYQDSNITMNNDYMKQNEANSIIDFSNFVPFFAIEDFKDTN